MTGMEAYWSGFIIFMTTFSMLEHLVTDAQKYDVEWYIKIFVFSIIHIVALGYVYALVFHDHAFSFVITIYGLFMWTISVVYILFRLTGLWWSKC